MKWVGCKFFMLAAVIFLLAGCGSEDPSEPVETTVPTGPVYAELEYETAAVSFSEPQGETYDVKNGWSAEYGGITYCFSNPISEADRNAVVNETAAVISRIGEKVGAVSGSYTLCVREDNYLPRVADRTLYIGLENFQSQEYAIGIAQMLFGNEMPYGLEYALGTAVAQEMGYRVETSEVELAEALDLYDSAPAYFDLNYACFLDAYAGEETLPKVKSLALGFYDYLARNGEMDLYTEYSNEKYREYLNEFLAANGKGTYDNSDLDGTIFYNGGTEIRLVWENSDGIFYVMEGYTARHVSVYGADMVNSGYANLRRLIVDYTAQAAYMREKLKDYDIVPDPATVLFVREREYEYHADGMYIAYDNEIHLYSPYTFMHEYCHYLQRDKGIESWLNECVCHYYTYYPVDEQITVLVTALKKEMDGLDSDVPGDELPSRIAKAAENYLGHEINWFSPEDVFWFFDVCTVASDMQNLLIDEEASVPAKLSFIHYLISVYGESETVGAIMNGTPAETLGKSWNGLIEDWKGYLEDNFAWVREADQLEGK